MIEFDSIGRPIIRRLGNPAVRRSTPIDIAWAAGIFEGEGSTTLIGTGVIAASVVQKDRWLCDILVQSFGGVVYPLDGCPKPGKCFTWRLTSGSARIPLYDLQLSIPETSTAN